MELHRQIDVRMVPKNLLDLERGNAARPIGEIQGRELLIEIGVTLPD